MIAAWMLFAVAIGALLGVAALAAELVVAARRWPRRVVWAAALVGSAAWPVAAAVQSRAITTESARVAVLPALRVTGAIQRATALFAHAAESSLVGLDTTLLAGWCMLSLMLGARLFIGIRVLRRRRNGWPSRIVDGHDVRLSLDVGPAVVGLRAMDIVLPQWMLAIDAPLRAMVLCHEEEHRRARDPLLLGLSAAAVVLMPWNPALWWHARRLRLALEMDCDVRVLRAHPQPERYGLLLLTIAQRQSLGWPLLAPALSEPASYLERRIIAMRNAVHVTRTRTVAFAAVAVAAIGVACSVDAPSATRGKVGATVASSASRHAPVGQSQPYFEFRVEKQVAQIPNGVAPRYPDMLRSANVEGEVLAQFVVDTTGRYEPGSFNVLKSNHDLFTNAVKAALPNMRFYAAEVGGRKVKQLVQMPFVFSLARR